MDEQKEISETPDSQPEPQENTITVSEPVQISQSNSNLEGLNEQRRLFEERTTKFESKIAADPWDTEAWTSLVMEAQTKDIRVARDVYERFLKQFPTAARFWTFYVEQEISSKNYDRADKIFARCLLKCPNIDLWKSYVKFIKITKENEPNGRSEIIKAYEYAIQHMGIDISSKSLWQDYISFLNEQQPQNQYDEGQKINALRKVYHRAIETPMHNLEDIWKEYDAYENELNKVLAKALINTLAPKYMAARTIYREKKRYYEGILRNMLARPPSTADAKDEQQVALWKRLIQYEKGNPQKLEPAQLWQRIVFTYNQCLLCLYHYPEIWFDFANYQISQGRNDVAINVFERGLEAIPDSLILRFAYADAMEAQKNYNAVKTIYENMVTKFDSTLVYIQYMKFIRRTEGIKNARPIFKKGRLSPNTGYQLFVASALMEWHINKDSQVARNIFELGMNKFGTDPEYIREYIKFLSHLNEENNLRALFERVVNTISPEQARDIWNMYVAFEYDYGDFAAITKIEGRRAKLYPDIDVNGILPLVNRYRFLDLWPCSSFELDTFDKLPEPAKELTVVEPDMLGGGEGSDPLQIARANPRASRFPRPDTSLMTAINLEAPPNGIPEYINQIIAALPPAASYQGPLIDVDQLMAVLLETPLPALEQPSEPTTPPQSTPAPATNPKKRPKADEEEEDEEQSTQPHQNAPPSNDLFRKRQAAKLRQKGFP